MRTLELKKGAIYGPIKSRRLGSSLGVNLLPGNYKLCTFNCLYCHYGWTHKHTKDTSCCLRDLPTVDQVRDALRGWLKKNPDHIAYITFSGNGEPCLHPEFDRMVEMTREVRDELAPQAKVAVLSNSTCLDDGKVMSGLRKIEVRIMKLDAGSEKMFKELNRPAEGIRLQDVVENLRRLDDIIVQSVFVKGRVDNTTEGEVEQWIGKLCLIKPREVQIYSIDRPSADEGLVLVERGELSRIAERAEKICGIPVKVF
jgi:wyosine [tRNA(Phe)-imidazoG37] synthetase (radical SAM superfamily)